MVRTCKQCGKEFNISEDEIKFYKRKKLDIPKRCEDCRKANRLKSKNNFKDDFTQETKSTEATSFKIDTKNIAKEDKKHFLNKKSNFIYAFIFFVISAVVSFFGYSYGINSPAEQEISNNNATNSNEIVQRAENKRQDSSVIFYQFRTEDNLSEHFEKHGDEFDYADENAYVEGANKVINSKEALQKTEKEDGDKVYYLQGTNEFVVVSTDGYIRTYFKPEDGIKYYNRQ